MPFTLVLPDGYNHVVAVALGVIPLIAFVHGSVASAKRKAAQVPYPIAYATAEQAKASTDAHVFNCAQRAHGNYLENMPQTIAMTLFAGLFYPQYTTYVASVWVLGRAMYAYGYIAGSKPRGAGRLPGVTVGWLAQGGLWGMCLYAAYTQLL